MPGQQNLLSDFRYHDGGEETGWRGGEGELRAADAVSLSLLFHGVCSPCSWTETGVVCCVWFFFGRVFVEALGGLWWRRGPGFGGEGCM